MGSSERWALSSLQSSQIEVNFQTSDFIFQNFLKGLSYILFFLRHIAVNESNLTSTTARVPPSGSLYLGQAVLLF